MNCRHCQHKLKHIFLDLGFAPHSNAYLSRLDRPELHYPLKLYVCECCWLVQTDDYAPAETLFNDDYPYFSSVSSSWLKHTASYSANIIQRLSLGPHSHVIEIAANDGYLLKNFVAAGIPCLGIEPTASTAAAAEKLGIPILRDFFDTAMATQLQTADLIIGNNVYAHVPNINDFTTALKIALKPGGTITLEFPHLMEFLAHTQFDTVYHEHFSYLSLYTVNRIFQQAGLRIYHVEQLPTHGGSLRIYGCHAEDSRSSTAAPTILLAEEAQRGMQDLATYQTFQPRVDQIKDDLLFFLLQQKRAGKRVAAYGAAAKGNTLLNYAGVKPDLLPYAYDAAPSKQGKYLPGSHIPILPPQEIYTHRPDIVLILPWNIQHEIKHTLADIRNWGGQFATAIPMLQID